MAKRGGPMHVVTTRRHYKDKVYETHLLRRSYREGGMVKNETLANLSHLPAEIIEMIRGALRGETFVSAQEVLGIDRSLPHGAAAAVWAMARRLGFPALLGEAGRMRSVAAALMVARMLRPASKLATTRWWSDTTLAEDLGVAGADTDDCYEALDWLGSRQETIESALAERHLEPGGLVLFDLSSSWLEGRTCPLGALGYSRDGKRGKLQVTYGVVANPDGCPVAVEVFGGNTADPTAFTQAVAKVRDRFGLTQVVMVGDRGMITQARIDALRDQDQMGWITALRAPQVKKLARDDGPLQLSLFDEEDLAEIIHPDYPDERLIACRNPALAQQRARKRAELLAATETELDKIAAAVEAGRLRDPAKIGVRVGRNINRYKMGKHFKTDISDGQFSYTRRQDRIAEEAALDGVYVIRTSVPATDLSTARVVEAYKSLAGVERLFRSLKTVDLHIRPIHHHLEQRVRAHIFLCLLAACLVYHLRRAWAPLTYTDQNPPARDDPVAPAQRSQKAQQKASRQHLEDGSQVRGFAELLDHLGTLTRNQVTYPGPPPVTFDKLTEPTPLQWTAFELVDTPIPLRLK